MGLKDRIEEEMVVDTESVLEEHFDDANQLFRIFQNGTIAIEDSYKDAPWKEKILIYFVGRQYAFEGGQAENPTLPYDFFYGKFDLDNSTIRAYMNDLKDDNVVQKSEESNEWELLVDNLPEALSRIEGVDV